MIFLYFEMQSLRICFGESTLLLSTSLLFFSPQNLWIAPAQAFIYSEFYNSTYKLAVRTANSSIIYNFTLVVHLFNHHMSYLKGYIVAIASLLAGASTVHYIYKPNLVIIDALHWTCFKLGFFKSSTHPQPLPQQYFILFFPSVEHPSGAGFRIQQE